MKKQLLILFTAAVAVLTGCKKDDDDSGSMKGKRVSKITEIDGDERSVIRFTYDSKNRISAYVNEGEGETATFTYDGTGNLIKMEQSEETSKEVYEISYNSKGEPTTGTRKTFDGTELQSLEDITYTVSNGRVTEIKTSSEDEITGVHKITYQGDNISKIEFEAEEGSYESTFSHDDKKSPFASAGFKYVLELGISTRFWGKNNMTSIKGGLQETTASYTYDNDGYPRTSEVTVKLMEHQLSKTTQIYEY
ncbi:hypothetical protein [Arcticibacter sp. MXS-1]|uniref:hypothetical protein n=1 Tax=Arcticibacter sp. MXS-1 TaxID=3341726 RepID=UPI0035A95BF2